MNRILAVRGQVVPVSPTPLTLHARLADGTVVDGQSQIMRTAGHRAGLADARRRPGVRGRARGDRRRRAHRPRPGQPVHEPPAEPAHPGDPRRGPRAPARRASSSATSRRRRARRPASTSPRTSRRSSPTRRPDLVDVVLANNHFDGHDLGLPPCRGGAAEGRSPALAAGVAARPRGSSSTTSSTRTNAHHHDPARLAAAVIRALEGEVGHAPPDARRRTTRADAPDVTRSERDLVTALRAELAAIDPSRPCDRVAEVAGLGPGADRRARRRSARLAHRLRRLRRHGRPAADRFDWDPPRTTAAALAARPVPRPRLAQPRRRPDPPRVRGRRPTRRPSWPPGSPTFGLPASWRLRRGRGVVTWKNGEAVGTFLRRIGASGALLELEARQVSRALRGELNRVLNAESANLQRAVSAAGRQLDAIATLEADGRLADAALRRPAGRRGAPRDARGEPGRARRAPRDPPLGRPARARAARAPRDDRGASARSAGAAGPSRSGMIRRDA